LYAGGILIIGALALLGGGLSKATNNAVPTHGIITACTSSAVTVPSWTGCGLPVSYAPKGLTSRAGFGAKAD
jgi:hypothetical protein